jgi:hypothetical protein
MAASSLWSFPTAHEGEGVVNKPLVDTAAIPGWGVDADLRNDPTFPIRHREDLETRGLTWERPTQQDPDVEILTSIEHNRLPAVIGTSTPPSGLSGMIRRYAFRRSESDWWHWLLLMGADRINVVEGVIEDFGHGKVPNIPAEMGARAEWAHNKKGLATKAAIVASVSLGLFMVFRERRTKDEPAQPKPALIVAGTHETALGAALQDRTENLD